MAKPRVNFLIQWGSDFGEGTDPKELSRTIDNLDAKIFKDKKFITNMWNGVALNIGKIIKKKFDEQGPGWRPLTPKYLKWKRNAVVKNKLLKIGTLGKRHAKFTGIGKLTGAMEKSATIRNKEGNIFEIQNVPGWKGGKFKYAIDLKKIPYAKQFDKDRPFFFLDNVEADKIMKKAVVKVRARMLKLFKAGKIER